MKFIITTSKNRAEERLENSCLGSRFLVSDNIPYHKAKKDKILWNKLRYNLEGYLVDDEEIGEDWTIEIDSIDHLLRLVEECSDKYPLYNGEIVISKYERNYGYYVIEIIDGHRN